MWSRESRLAYLAALSAVSGRPSRQLPGLWAKQNITPTAYPRQTCTISSLCVYFYFFLMYSIDMIDSSFKRGLSLWRKLSLISWCLLLWCERRRRHVRSNAEVDHLGLWRRQRQVQASEQRPNVIGPAITLPFDLIGDIHSFIGCLYWCTQCSVFIY